MGGGFEHCVDDDDEDDDDDNDEELIEMPEVDESDIVDDRLDIIFDLNF